MAICDEEKSWAGGTSTDQVQRLHDLAVRTAKHDKPAHRQERRMKSIFGTLRLERRSLRMEQVKEVFAKRKR